MIKITQEETNALVILNNSARQIQEELTRQVGARQSMISLLELKYNAKFNEQTGVFEDAQEDGRESKEGS